MTVATFWALEEILAATLTILFPWVATKCEICITKQINWVATNVRDCPKITIYQVKPPIIYIWCNHRRV